MIKEISITLSTWTRSPLQLWTYLSMQIHTLVHTTFICPSTSAKCKGNWVKIRVNVIYVTTKLIALIFVGERGLNVLNYLPFVDLSHHWWMEILRWFLCEGNTVWWLFSWGKGGGWGSKTEDLWYMKGVVQVKIFPHHQSRVVIWA